MNANKLNIFAWGLSGVVCLLAVYAWGNSYEWDVIGLSLYQYFPLFGLLAFSLMWSHYIASVVRQFYSIDKSVLRQYFDITSYLVLIFILLHPSLLALQRWRDGFGLPPGSQLGYMGPMLKYAIVLGMIALPLILMYELRRFYSGRKWWKFVEIAVDIAVVLAYIHSLKLGGLLQAGWYKTVWLFYGITLIMSIAYIYKKKLSQSIDKN